MINYLNSLNNLYALNKEEEDEEDIYLPTEYAFKEARALFKSLYLILGCKFPYCSCSLKTRGGIDLVWDNPKLNRRIWAGIPYISKDVPYIFYREKEVRKFTEDFTLDKLVNLLDRLTKDNFID
jgi:hypothetical protein